MQLEMLYYLPLKGGKGYEDARATDYAKMRNALHDNRNTLQAALPHAQIIVNPTLDSHDDWLRIMRLNDGQQLLNFKRNGEQIRLTEADLKQLLIRATDNSTWRYGADAVQLEIAFVPEEGFKAYHDLRHSLQAALPGHQILGAATLDGATGDWLQIKRLNDGRELLSVKHMYNTESKTTSRVTSLHPGPEVSISQIGHHNDRIEEGFLKTVVKLAEQDVAWTESDIAPNPQSPWLAAGLAQAAGDESAIESKKTDALENKSDDSQGERGWLDG